MIRLSKPRCTRLLLALLFASMAVAASSALAGNTHSEGGSVVEAPGVPETDGIATVQIYWTGDSAARTSVVTGTPLPGYWLQDVGFAFARQWQVGDEHVATAEFQTAAGTAAHAGYYGAATRILTSLDPDEFPGITMRPIPVPMATSGPGTVELAWNRARSSGTTNAIAGYHLYRSTDGIAFTKLTTNALPDTTYQDATALYGTTYYYAIKLVYAGTPSYEGSAMSGNSAPATPADATPPDVPVIAAEPAFTAGAANTIAWSSEVASGATAYWAECAVDSAFTSLMGNSGWTPDSTFSFSGLADGLTYYYRVRARDAAANASEFSSPTHSRQDASKPASQLLTLASYKASSTLDLEWTAIDSISGIASVQLFWSKDGGPFAVYPGGPFTTSPIAFDASTTGGDGQYGFYTLATDAVANAEDAPETPDATTIVDTQPPAIPTLAALASFTAGDTRDLSWSSAAASGAASYRVQASLTDDFAAIASDSDWLPDSTYTFTGLADATYYAYRVQSRDEAGNESDWSTLAASTQDGSAPETTVDALPSAITNSSSIDLAWTGSDATSGLASVDLYWSKDGAEYAALEGGPFTTSPIAFDMAAHGGDGLYTFYTIGTDAVANTEAAPASADAQIELDTAAPGAPAIAAIPAFTAGSERTIGWGTDGAAAFRAQAASDPDFASLAGDSDWMSDSTFTFTGLVDNQMYWYRVQSRDSAGNESGFSATQSSTQDASAPESAADSLPALSSTTALSIAWTGTDAASGLASVELWYSKDGGPFAQYAGGPFATSPIAFDAATTGGDGAYAFYTIGMDAVGNTEAAPASPDAQTAIDTAAPGAPTIAGLQTFSPGTSLHVSWSDESATGAAEYQAELATDAAFTTIATTSGWLATLSHDFTALTDGQSYWVRVKARDAAQNETGFSGMQSTTMDATAPQAWIDQLQPEGNDPHLQLAWTGSDTTSGILDVDLYWSKDGGPFALLDGGPFTGTPIPFDATTTGDGEYSFFVRARDRAGNLEDAPATPDAMTMIDMTPPDAPALAALPSFTLGTTAAIGWSDESASGAASYLVQTSPDSAFTTIAFASDWIGTPSFLFTSLTDGTTYYYRAKSRDALGNESAFGAALHSTQDATPPESAVDALPPLMSIASLELTWSGSDATSGLQEADLYWSKDGGPFALLEGGPFAASPITFDASSHGGDGQYAFYTIARDVAGNAEAAPAAADAQTTVDTAAPSAPTLAALPGFTSGAAVDLSWNDLGAGTAYRAQASTDASFSSIAQDSDWITQLQYTFASLGDAQPYYFRVQARDAANNTSGFSATTTTTMDAVAPTSQLEALPNLLNTMIFPLNWSGYDLTSGIAGVDLYSSRNGAPFALHPDSPFTTSPITFDASPFGGDGQYAFYVRSHDGAGNVEDVPAAPGAQTRIDTTPPNVPTITALPQFSPGSSVLLMWDSQSASGAIEYLAEMSIDADFSTLAGTSGWIPTTSWNNLSLDDGTTYYFRVKSRDAALNESAPAAIQNTTLDDTPPASAVSELAAVTTTLTFPMAWTGSDATSGVSGVDLYYARNGGAYTEYPGGPFPSSPIAFDASTVGGQGNYAFYTRARDAVGNREPAPGGPDAQTIVSTAAVGSPTIAELPLFTAGTTQVISWTPGGNNDSYLAEVSSDETFATITAQSGWITPTNWTFTGLADGHTYWYRVRARNSIGVEGPYSLLASSIQDATPPQSQVDALPALQASTLVSIAWTGGDATSGVTGVRLYAARDGGAFSEFTGGPFITSPIAFDAAAMGGDGTYAFYTRAVDGAGNVELAPPQPDANTTIDTTAPNAPTMMAEPLTTQGTVNAVAWNAVNGAAEYEIECATDAAFANVTASSDWIAATSFTFTDLTFETTYYYHVRARDLAGNVGAFSAAVSSTQSAGYVLPAGWNLISFNVTPTDARIDRVLESIAGSYAIVRTYDHGVFTTYLPGLPLDMNDLREIDARRGYWIYMTQADTLTFGGNPLAASTPIDLQAGWNLASYLPRAPRSTSVALGSIATTCAVARGYEPASGYRSFYPSVPTLSDLLEMRPGQGYWLYMTVADVLVYSGLPKPAAESMPRGLAIATRSDAMSVPTVMDLYSKEFTIDGKPAPEGTVVEAYDADGHRMACVTVTTAGILPILHLLGDVSITETDEGFVDGETFTLRVRDKDVTLVGDVKLVWQANEAKALDLEYVATESLLPKIFALGQNAPNPFNPITTIYYEIPARVAGQRIESTHIALQVYDIRGRVVRTLMSGEQAPGRYSIQWNGRDERGVSVSSGVYFCRLRAESFSQTRKMLLVK